jgi:hypothetical protein
MRDDHTGTPMEPHPAAALSARLHFQTFGFVALRGAFDPWPLSRELDEALSNAAFAPAWGPHEMRFGYAPMMTARTPASLRLLDRLEAVAIELLGGPVVPTRAKGVRYSGDTPWHVDSEDANVASVGFAAYLEPLRAETGALRVLPGSHRARYSADIRAAGSTGLPAGALPSHVVSTDPGDVVAFDEHLFHASAGGAVRGQWRLDYVTEPEDEDGAARVKAYFARIFPADWGGGYDVDEHPSYGTDWLASGRRAVARLADLGVYELASRHEAFARSRQSSRLT